VHSARNSHAALENKGSFNNNTEDMNRIFELTTMPLTKPNDSLIGEGK
jgi:hypothetical protein